MKRLYVQKFVKLKMFWFFIAFSKFAHRHFFLTNSYKAASVGAKDSEGINVLEKKLKENENAFSDLSLNDSVDEAIAALQKVLHEDCKATELEVSVVDKSGFRALSVEEIGQHLEAIAEKE